jgi:Amt family ammonium transporter
VLLAFVLVLAMFPGLALFEAGLLRAKNSLSILIQIFSGLTTLSVLWDLVGYSLVFGAFVFVCRGHFLVCSKKKVRWSARPRFAVFLWFRKLGTSEAHRLASTTLHVLAPSEATELPPLASPC